jgi:hypothetical protein
MKPGQRSYIPGAGYIRVLAVDEVDLAALCDDDARRDGFASAEALRTEITMLYALQLAAGQRAFRIGFALFSPEEQAAVVEQKKASRK